MALIKCPDCASDVSTEALACPKCGRPIAPPTIGAFRPQPETAPRRRTTAKDVIGGLVAGIGVLVLLSYCASSVDDNSSTTTAASTDQSSTQDYGSSSPAEESRPIQAYTAAQLYGMFHANEIKAKDTIGNAIVRFTGRVASIQQSDFSKTPELDILANCFVPGDCEDVDAWNTIRADLAESQASAASSLVKGQTITLQCNQVGMPVDVYAQDCVIVPAAAKSGTSDADGQ